MRVQPGCGDHPAAAAAQAEPDALEILAQFGTPEQQERWLRPLLDGEIRSCFSMTEPEVASSDATNIRSRIVREGDDYVVNGHKWWTSGIADPRCRVIIFMGKTDPDAPSHQQQTMVLVPVDTPGVTVVRSLSVLGFDEGHGHCEVRYEDVRVPVGNRLGEEGGGFAIAQARLGPGRIHHCMRAIGMAERAFELMCERVAPGSPSASRSPSRGSSRTGSRSRGSRSSRPGSSSSRRRG